MLRHNPCLARKGCQYRHYLLELFVFGWCFKDYFLILVSECDAAKNISSFLGICSVLSSQVKAESCKLLGKNSSILGIWADWDLGLSKHWLQWFVSHFNVSICYKKCWSERMLWIAGTAASVCTTVLSSTVWSLTRWAVLFPHGPRPATVAVRRPRLCLRVRTWCKRLLFVCAVIWSKGGPCWCQGLQWALSSCPPCGNPWEPCCRAVL